MSGHPLSVLFDGRALGVVSDLQRAWELLDDAFAELDVDDAQEHFMVIGWGTTAESETITLGCTQDTWCEDCADPWDFITVLEAFKDRAVLQ